MFLFPRGALRDVIAPARRFVEGWDRLAAGAGADADAGADAGDGNSAGDGEVVLAAVLLVVAI